VIATWVLKLVELKVDPLIILRNVFDVRSKDVRELFRELCFSKKLLFMRFPLITTSVVLN
jgi:hypothetical protein